MRLLRWGRREVDLASIVSGDCVDLQFGVDFNAASAFIIHSCGLLRWALGALGWLSVDRERAQEPQLSSLTAFHHGGRSVWRSSCGFTTSDGLIHCWPRDLGRSEQVISRERARKHIKARSRLIIYNGGRSLDSLSGSLTAFDRLHRGSCVVAMLGSAPSAPFCPRKCWGPCNCGLPGIDARNFIPIGALDERSATRPISA